MKITELSLGGPSVPLTPIGDTPDKSAGTAPMGAQTGLSPQQQAAKHMKDLNDKKRLINDQIATLTKQMAELRKQLINLK
jgi:hypothetical protein